MKLFVALPMLILPLGLAILAEGKDPQSSILMETADLAAKLSAPSLRIIDARPASDYRQGHIPGAVNLPAASTDSPQANAQGYPITPQDAELLFRAAGINQSSQVVVYDSHGHRSAARIFYVLEFFGHPNVAVLNGGFPKWQGEARPISAERPTVNPGDFTPNTNSAAITTADWVKQHLNDPRVRLVDARSSGEYAGSPAQGPRGGHIPSAVHLEWTRFLAQGDTPTLLSLPEMTSLVASASVQASQEVVAYCQSGMRASVVYFALRLLGFPRVRLYDGSWAEWSALADFSVEK